MKFQKKIYFFILSLFISGCGLIPTPYQPEDPIMGGYSQFRLSENVYSVTFRGNRASTPLYVARMLLRRAADLTKQNGYNYFAIIGGNQHISSAVITSPTMINTTGNANYSGTGMGFGNMYNYQGYSNYNQRTYVTPGMSSIIHAYTDTIGIKMYKKKRKGIALFDANIILQNY